MSQNGIDKAVERILSECKTVAVVGLSRDPSKDSHAVASYLQSRGYEIVPINPFCDEVLGKKCYRSRFCPIYGRWDLKYQFLITHRCGDS